MDTKIKELEFDDIDFEVNSSQQFATVIFERSEDSLVCAITIIQDGKIKQFDGNNTFNPSKRRHSTCVYIKEEDDEDGRTIKICTIQHKGITLVEIHSVSEDELLYLFNIK